MVLREAGKNTPSLVEHGRMLVKTGELGPAECFLEAARLTQVSGVPQLEAAVATTRAQYSEWELLGGRADSIERLVQGGTGPPSSLAAPERGAEAAARERSAAGFTALMVRSENRQRVLAFLEHSQHPAVQEILRCRALTNLVLFTPSASASGQAIDTAIGTCGLLLEQSRLTPALAQEVRAAAAMANQGGHTEGIESCLLDFMSLGQRFNWGQLAAFVKAIPEARSLRLLTMEARAAQERLPVLFCAVEWTGDPAAVAKYLSRYRETGLGDVTDSLRFGAGGVKELVHRGARLYSGSLAGRSATRPYFIGLSWLALRAPGAALALKWALYFGAGFLLALALHLARPAPSALERPLQVPGFHLAREILFALGFLVVVLLVSEPFLAQESQKVEMPLRLRLPMVASAVAPGTAGADSSFMNQLSLLTLLLFFVLQGLLYTACLFKLAEIRRQKVAARVKLKLLENEEHLFDGGLYLGFVGTIISLILVSLGVVKPSLMAAYSSTSFGIIFVSIFKIFHLRPYRRTLLLEAETGLQEPVPSAGTPALAPTP
jgi:hypothetical protein